MVFPEARLREDTSLLWTVAAHSLQAFPMNCSIYSIWIIRIQPATSLSRDGKRAQTIHACGFASCSREPQTPTSVVPFLWTPKIAKWQRTRKAPKSPCNAPCWPDALQLTCRRIWPADKKRVLAGSRMSGPLQHCFDRGEVIRDSRWHDVDVLLQPRVAKSRSGFSPCAAN